MLTQNILRCRRFVVALHAIQRAMCDKMIPAEVDNFDAMDAFTTHLVSQTGRRNKVVKASSMCPLVKESRNAISLAGLGPAAVDEEMMRLTNDGDHVEMNAFLTRCLQDNVCPSFQCVLCLLDAHGSNPGIVVKAKRLLEAQPSPLVDLYRTHASFDHYVAEACWTNGEVIKSLQLFDDVYRNHSALRRRIKTMLKSLIAGVTAQSEAVLVSVVNFSEEWYSKYKEAFPLVCLWQACFLSDCYEDHKLSMELIDRNPGLCECIVGHLPHVVATSLRANRVENVYQLLELLLRHEMKQHYGSILVPLFDYKCAQGDLRSCSEIVQWSVLYNVALPHLLRDRFLMLLCKGKQPKTDNLAVRKPPNITLKF